VTEFIVGAIEWLKSPLDTPLDLFAAFLVGFVIGVYGYLFLAWIVGLMLGRRRD